MTGHDAQARSRLSNEELLETAHGFEAVAYRDAVDVEISSTRALYQAAPSEVAQRLGVEAHEVGRSTLFVAPGLPQLMFNRVELRAGDGQISGEELRSSLRIFADRGVSHFLVQVDAPASGEPTRQLMAAEQLLPFRRPWVKLVRDSAPLPTVATDFEVVEATASQAGVFAALMVQGFALPAAAVELYSQIVERPGWRAYLALDPQAGVAVAAGLAFIEGACCYLAGGVTLPAYRRRQAQRVLMHRRIEDARLAGVTCITTETGLPLATEENPSYRNMIHLGFRAVGTRDNYAPAGTRW
ncbi:MAG TPA: hypothetical protein VI197_19325 [Polyangiaceae bacterium]